MILSYKPDPEVMTGHKFDDVNSERQINNINYNEINKKFDNKNEQIKIKKEKILKKIEAKYAIGNVVNYLKNGRKSPETSQAIILKINKELDIVLKDTFTNETVVRYIEDVMNIKDDVESLEEEEEDLEL